MSLFKKILIVAATEEEIKPTKELLLAGTALANSQQLYWLVTGPGIAATCFALAQYLAAEKPDIIINAGIAGSFNHDLKLGQVVLTKRDTFCDFGAQDDQEFIHAFDLPIADKNKFPFNDGWLNYHQDLITYLPLSRVTAITSDTGHGNEAHIQRLTLYYNPDIETMEGAAVAYCAGMYSITAISVRAISNYVEKRNRAAWEVNLAIENLNHDLLKILVHICALNN
ncbi:MAG: futalosine hydrolase [Bacteroidetes bacterium]|nr:futalosine hydrolase [Bacteroidota bacterium]